MSFSFSKLKSFLPINQSENNATTRIFNKRSSDKLEPEIGFKLILAPNGNYGSNPGSSNQQKNIPELNVHITSARHLPTSFGLKSVEGYLIKVKLFPGSTRYDSSVQTTSWPKFNETFKFPLAPSLKSSIRRNKESASKTLPEKLFKGHFVVLTAFALLDLPPTTVSAIKEKYQSIKRKGSVLLKDGRKTEETGNSDETEDKKEKSIFGLTKSESRRNVGSVTFFLDPKIFEENNKTGHFCSEEIWQPFKDISTSIKSNVTSATSRGPKGQLEVILQITEPLPEDEKIDEPEPEPEIDIVALNSGISSSYTKATKEEQPIPTKSRWNFSDMKRKITGSRKEKRAVKGSSFKLIISKMRCSMKVKEEFENIAGEDIYIKATIFERDIYSSAWKSKHFAPMLSMKWDPDDASIVIPLVNDYEIEYITIKITLATKSNVGKKIVLGTLILGAKSEGEKLDQWDEMISSKGTAITKWHNFE